MILLNNDNPMSTIIADNPGKSIGKFNLNFDKIRDNDLKLHTGHRKCITQVNKFDIRVIELSSIKFLGYEFKDAAETDDAILEMAQRVIPTADYIIYNAPDTLTEDIDPAIVAQVQTNVDAEDYIARLHLPNPKAFVLGMAWATRRGQTGYTCVRSWKTGTENYGWAHYLEKYLGIHTVMVDVSFHRNTKIPMHGSCTLEELPEEYKEACAAFDADHTAFSDYPFYIELTDTEFVPNGKTFITCQFKNDTTDLALGKLI
jgi:hypothetical protein